MLDYVVFGSLLLIGLVIYFLDKLRGMRGQGWHNDSPYFEQLKKCESPIERQLCRSLWINNILVDTQHKVGPYRLDMALPNIKLAIECDGKAYHSSPAQKAKDKKRDSYLKTNGWTVVRVSGRQIHSHMGNVLKKVEMNVAEQTAKLNKDHITKSTHSS